MREGGSFRLSVGSCHTVDARWLPPPPTSILFVFIQGEGERSRTIDLPAEGRQEKSPTLSAFGVMSLTLSGVLACDSQHTPISPEGPWLCPIVARHQGLAWNAPVSPEGPWLCPVVAGHRGLAWTLFLCSISGSYHCQIYSCPDNNEGRARCKAI